MLQDTFELNTVKMKAEMHIQNEKLEFLFKTLAERSERRSTRKRIKQNQEEVQEEEEEEEEWSSFVFWTNNILKAQN